MKRTVNPFKITFIWLATVVLLGYLLAFVDSQTQATVNQNSNLYLFYAFEIGLVGTLLINIATLLFFQNKNKWNSVMLISLSLLLLYFLQ
jgi:hypothetical protein